VGEVRLPRADVAAVGRKGAAGHGIGDDQLSVFRSISAANFKDLVASELLWRHTGWIAGFPK